MTSFSILIQSTANLEYSIVGQRHTIQLQMSKTSLKIWQKAWLKPIIITLDTYVQNLLETHSLPLSSFGQNCYLLLQCPTLQAGTINILVGTVLWELISPECVVKLTIASKISNGQSPSKLQLMVMRWNPGQDPLKDAALSSLKQLLHGLIYTT